MDLQMEVGNKERYRVRGGGFHSWASASSTHPQGGQQLDESYSPEVDASESVRNKRGLFSVSGLIEQSWIPRSATNWETKGFLLTLAY